jgi:hypothetical protein
MNEWKYPVHHFLYVFFYEHIYMYIYVQEKFDIMKNKILMK